MLDAMSHERWKAIASLLDAALDAALEERVPLLEQACGSDVELRLQVERLLKAGEREDGPLNKSAADICGPLLDAGFGAIRLTPDIGARIGPFRITGIAGRGGMGAVFVAERADDQFRQRVALKVVRRGLDDSHLLHRFLEERRILAALEHPNIARLLDGGVTGDGIPWFAMELVEGEPIDRYCDARTLTISERLRLFLDICTAVQYAHGSLVIHRDLKPSNVLVTASGTVKLLDFGIAKLVAGAEEERDAAPTRTGQRLLTPEYASPEQLRGNSVSTASDVYSLGVMLFELLTGERPYRATRALSREVERAIVDDDAERPSTIAGKTVNERAAARRATAAQLRRRLRGDLDTIVLTAMRKDPAHRYATVERLAADVRRHLEGRPISARPQTLRYRAGRLLRRHPWRAAAAAGFVLLLGSFGVVSSMQSARTAREADKARRLSGFLVNLFATPNPWNGRGAAITARELLDSGAARIDRELADQPAVRGQLLWEMGRAYWGLGLYDRSKTLLDSALAIKRRTLGNDADVASELLFLSDLTFEHGDLFAAESLAAAALTSRRAHARSGDAALIMPLLYLAEARRQLDRSEEAEPLVLEAVAIQRSRSGRDPLALALALNDLGHVKRDLGDYAAAESLYREALGIRRASLGDEHPDVANLLVNVALAAHQRGDTAAVTLFRRGLEIKRRLFGDHHPEIALDQSALAEILADRGELAAAESLYRTALQTQRAALAPAHPRIATSLAGLGRTLLEQGATAPAETAIREAIGLMERSLPSTHSRLADARSLLGACLTAQRRYAEAESLLVASAGALEKRWGPGDRRSRRAHDRLAVLSRR